MNFIAPNTKGERTRAHIVATAAGLFWRRSYHGVSVDQIAQAAEVNKATVYRYFADKSDLALAVTRFNGQMSLDVIFAGTFASVSAPQDRLSEVYRRIHCSHVAAIRDEGDVFGCPIIGLALELGQENPALRAEASHIFNRVEGLLRDVAQDARVAGGHSLDPQALGRTLTQLLHGAFASARIASDPQFILDAGHASLALIGFPDIFIDTSEQTA